MGGDDSRPCTHHLGGAAVGAFIFIVVLAGAIWVAVMIVSALRNSEVIECASCGNRMTRGRFHQLGGCPRCGSDLFRPTGIQPRS